MNQEINGSNEQNFKKEISDQGRPEAFIIFILFISLIIWLIYIYNPITLYSKIELLEDKIQRLEDRLDRHEIFFTNVIKDNIKKD